MDTIRAVLSVVVLLYHWGLATLIARLIPGLTGGKWGLAVDYFFVLSGFVLGLSLSRRSTDFFRFIAVRAFRLLPVAVTALALCLLVDAFSSPASPEAWGEIATNLILAQSLVSERTLPEAMWSASFEMWLPSLFYLFRFVRLFTAWQLALLLIAFLLFQCQVVSMPLLATRGWGGALARAASGLGSGFLLGSLFLQLRELLSPKASSTYFLCGSLCFVAAIGSILFAPDFYVCGMLFPFFSALSIVCLAAAERGSGRTLPAFARGAVEFTATRSYSIYLIHMPLISLSSLLLGTKLSGNAPLKFALICMTIILYDVVYRLVEVPGYRLRKKFQILG